MDQKKIIIRDGAQMPFAGIHRLPDGTHQERLGSGVVTALLSRGGTALVYEIWNQHLEVKRAVKLLDPEHLDESLERFETEIKISAKLHHPNIVEIFNVGVWNELPYIEMERVDGFTLEELLGKRGAFPVEVCTSLGIMVGKALNYAHNHDYMVFGKEYRGIIHRDLKPANIMVDRSTGVAKLMDFGIAKPVNASGRTMEGMVMGTMAYLAPEQLQGGEVDPRADIYSFGSVLYELLTGRKTFPEENLAKLVTDKLSSKFPDIATFAVKCPATLKKVISRCLNFDTKNRVQDAASLVRKLIAVHRKLTDLAPEEVLRRFLTQDSVPRRSVSLTRFPVPLFLIVQFIAAAAVLSAGGWLWYTLNAARTLTPYSPPLVEQLSDPDSNLRVAPESVSVALRSPLAQSVKQTVSAQTQSARSASVQPAGQTTAPPAVASPALQPQKRTAEPPLSPLQQIQRRYGTTNNSVIMERLAANGRHRDVIRLWNLLTQTERASVANRIYALRAYQNSGSAREIERFLLQNETADAEFYGVKSLFFSAAGNPGAAKVFLDKCMKTSGQFMDPEKLEELRLNARASCASAVLAAQPSSENRKEAMDAWYEIKLKYRSQPQSDIYQSADKEIRRIATTPQ